MMDLSCNFAEKFSSHILSGKIFLKYLSCFMCEYTSETRFSKSFLYSEIFRNLFKNIITVLFTFNFLYFFGISFVIFSDT